MFQVLQNHAIRICTNKSERENISSTRKTLKIPSVTDLMTRNHKSHQYNPSNMASS